MRIYFVSIFLIFLSDLVSQNLVPNPSFESFLYNKNDYFKTLELNEVVDFWYSPIISSPDLLVNRSSKDQYTENGPSTDRFNILLDSQAYSGIACVGLILQVGFGETLNSPFAFRNREYIQTKLNKPLKKNSYYYISFYYKLSHISDYAIDGLGVKLTKKPMIKNNNYGFGDGSKISNPKGDIMYNTYWKKFETSIKCEEKFRYITIGNFSENISYERVRSVVPDTVIRYFYSSYYLIDSVLIKKIPKPKAQIIVKIDMDSTKCDDSKPEEVFFNQDSIIKTFKLNYINFKFGEAIISNSTSAVLDSIIFELNTIAYNKLLIIGYADTIGNFEYNMELSYERALSVSEYLQKKGIDEQLIDLVGKGEDEFFDFDNIEKNRRVEIILIK